ncbi:MAG: hypothetical protein ACPLRJ_08055 [Infirmifilum uzonense]|uniref:hypothetical protein n=1 Tax=Infirmifilum uzonense TaxID=1550241 RepID=UPI003C792D2F
MNTATTIQEQEYDRLDELYTNMIFYLTRQQGQLVVIKLSKLIKPRAQPGTYIPHWRRLLDMLENEREVTDAAGRVWYVKRIYHRNHHGRPNASKARVYLTRNLETIRKNKK